MPKAVGIDLGTTNSCVAVLEGGETVVILENFAHVLQEVIGRTQVKHVVVTSVGELLGFPKGAIVDFVVRTVRKQVPAWSLPGHHRFLDVLAASGPGGLAA